MRHLYSSRFRLRSLRWDIGWSDGEIDQSGSNGPAVDDSLVQASVMYSGARRDICRVIGLNFPCIIIAELTSSSVFSLPQILEWQTLGKCETAAG